MVSYAYGMTTKGTPGHVIRVDTETWDAYGEACMAKGLSRAADLRVYMNREIAAHRRRVREEAAHWNAGATEPRDRDVDTAQNIAKPPSSD